MILRPSDARLIENAKKMKPPISWPELRALMHEACVTEDRAKMAFADALRYTLGDAEHKSEIRKARIRLAEATAHSKAIENLMKDRQAAEERAKQRRRKAS